MDDQAPTVTLHYTGSRRTVERFSHFMQNARAIRDKTVTVTTQKQPEGGEKTTTAIGFVPYSVQRSDDANGNLAAYATYECVTYHGGQSARPDEVNLVLSVSPDGLDNTDYMANVMPYLAIEDAAVREKHFLRRVWNFQSNMFSTPDLARRLMAYDTF